LGIAAEGQNLLLQHLLTDLGMVGGQQVGAQFGLVERPQGSFAQQMVQAEALNWSQKGGMALLHGLSPDLLPMEKSMDLYLRSQETDLFSKGQPALPFFSRLVPEGPEISLAQSMKPDGKEKNIVRMTKKDGDEGNVTGPLVELVEPDENPPPKAFRISRVSVPSVEQVLEKLKTRLQAPIEKGSQWMRISALPQEALQFHTNWRSSKTDYLSAEIAGHRVLIPLAAWEKMDAWFSLCSELERKGYFLARKVGHVDTIEDFIPLGSLAMDIPSASSDLEASQTSTSEFELFGIKGEVARGLDIDLESQRLLSFQHTSKEDPLAVSIPIHSHHLGSRYPNGPSQTDQSIAGNSIELVYGLLSNKGFLYDGTSVMEVGGGQPVRPLEGLSDLIQGVMQIMEQTGMSRPDLLIPQAVLETFRTFLRNLTPEECEEVARRFQDPLKSGPPAVRQAAVELAAILIPYIPYETETSKLLRNLLGDLEREEREPHLQAAAKRAFSEEIGKNHVARHSTYPMGSAIKMGNPGAFERALERWEKEDFPFLTPYDFRTLALRVEEQLADEDTDVRYCALKTLTAIVPYLHPTDRPLRIRRIFEGLLDDRIEIVKLAQEGLERLGARRIAESMGPVVAEFFPDEGTRKEFDEIVERMRRREIGQFTDMDDSLIGERVMAIAGPFPFGTTLLIRDIEPTNRLILADGKKLGTRWIPVHQVGSIRAVFKALEERHSNQKN
jgi:hypothetical protein